MTSLVLSSFANPALLAPITLAVGALILVCIAWRQQPIVRRALCLGAAVALGLAVVAQSAPPAQSPSGRMGGIAALVPLLGWPVAHALLTR